MEAFAQFFYYFAENHLLNAATTKLLGCRQGPAKLETSRAKDIVERVCTAPSTSCRALGDAILGVW
jgi:hypothetical protein